MELNEQQVIKDYYKLRSCRAVSEKYGCSSETIRRILKRNGFKLTGWKRPPKKPNRHRPAHIPYTDEEVINAYLRLGTQDKVSDELGISHTTVYRILKRNNIPSNGRQGNHGGGTPSKITDEQLIKACETMTRQEIADAYGMHVVSVDRRMRKLGIHALYITRERKRPKPKRTWEEYNLKRKQEAEDRALLKAEEKRKYREAHTVTRKCVICGASFNCLDTKTNKTCSHDCSIALQRRCKDKRIPKEQRVDKISLDLLFKRDQGKCWICGGDCDWNDWRISKNGYQYPGDNYPTRDHVVPIARGGLDSWDNVRLAHWLCNLKKSDGFVNAVPIDFDFAYSYKRKGQQPKRTAQYSLNGELIKIWDSTAQIERELGLKSKHIQNVCRGDNSNTGNAYGYHWEYIREA